MSKPTRTSFTSFDEKPRTAPEKAQESVQSKRAGEGAGYSPPPSRVGKSHVGGYFPPEVRQTVRTLAAEQDRTVQDVVAEALNMVFAANGKPEVAPRD